MSAARPNLEAQASGATPRSLAARAGRWSAQHRKTAIWGWLAFVVLAFTIGGAVGTKTLEHTQTGVGESGRADQTIANAAPEHAEEMVLIQSTGRTAADPAFRAVVGRRAATAGGGCPTPRTSRARYAPANANQISATGTRPCSASRSPATTPRSWTGSSRPLAGRRAPCRRRTRASPSASSATPAPSSRSTTSIQRRLRQGPDHLPADHPDHPADRLRRARRRRRAAAAGADRGHRDDRPHRSDQPRHRRGGQLDQRGDPADRPRRRGRLLDVLPAPRARGARGGAQRRGVAGRRGGDLGPRGDGLRLHGDDRHGRDVPGRRRRPSSRSPPARSSSSPWRWSAR